MDILIGSVLTVALVLLLMHAVRQPTLGELEGLRMPAHMLLLGIPALVVPTDLWAIAALAGSSMAAFEAALVLLAL